MGTIPQGSIGGLPTTTEWVAGALEDLADTLVETSWALDLISARIVRRAAADFRTRAGLLHKGETLDLG
jgi:hypothetical protein